jgi:hypothetical protein
VPEPGALSTVKVKGAMPSVQRAAASGCDDSERVARVSTAVTPAVLQSRPSASCQERISGPLGAEEQAASAHATRAKRSTRTC